MRPLSALVVAIAALLPLACARAPHEPRTPTTADYRRYSELTDAGYTLINKGDFRMAERVLNEAIARVPDSPWAWYNRACAASRSGKTAEAIGFLARAVDLGWENAAHMTGDPDLAGARKDPRFQDLANRAKANAAWNANALEEIRAGALGAAEEVPASLQAIRDRWDKEIETIRGAAMAAYPETLALVKICEVAARKGADLRAYIAARPDAPDVREAIVELIRLLDRDLDPLLYASDGWRAGSPAMTEERDRLTREFLERWPSDPLAARVRYISNSRAQRLHDTPPAAETEKPVEAAGGTTVPPAWVGEFRAIAADFPGTSEAGLSLVQVAAWGQDHGGASGAAEAEALWKAISTKYGAEKEVMKAAGYPLQRTIRRVEGIPLVNLRDLDGNPMTLEAARGKLLLIDFWATWCGPCIQELPNLRKLYAEYRERGFEVYGISLDDLEDLSADALRAWVKKNEVPWPQAYDGKGFDSPVAEAFRIQAIPTMILLDREGKVLEPDIAGEELREAVEKELGAASGPAPATG